MGGIPEFPEYAPVDGGMGKAFNEYTARYQPYSDFNFVSILSWDVTDSARVTVLNDNLVIRLPDYVDGTEFYSFLGDNQVEGTVATLLDEAERHTDARKLRLVPEIGARALVQPSRYSVVEDADGHDYVISLPAVAARKGAGFRHMRREVNFFTGHYAQDISFQEMDIRDPAVQSKVVAAFPDHETGRSGQPQANERKIESVALGRLLGNADSLALSTFGVEVSGVLKAFIVCEKIDEQWCVGHFWKADTAYRGIYRYLMAQVAEQLVTEGMVHMNIEQDLGIKGLRHMKMRLNPVDHLKKYTITDATH